MVAGKINGKVNGKVRGVSKNATAVERAERNHVFSGHFDAKDGRPIFRDELRMVKRIVYDEKGRRSVTMVPYAVRNYPV
jgi:hypothetical protein